MLMHIDVYTMVSSKRITIFLLILGASTMLLNVSLILKHWFRSDIDYGQSYSDIILKPPRYFPHSIHPSSISDMGSRGNVSPTSKSFNNKGIPLKQIDDVQIIPRMETKVRAIPELPVGKAVNGTKSPLNSKIDAKVDQVRETNSSALPNKYKVDIENPRSERKFKVYNEVCRSLQPPRKLSYSRWVDTFVGPGTGDYVFSAYYDDRNGERLVRVVAFSATKERSFCQIWFKDPKTGEISLEIVSTKMVYVFRNCANNMLPPVLINCRVNSSLIPYAVSIVRYPCETHVQPISVSDTTVSSSAKPPADDSFGVCVKALHGDNPSSSRLVEFIETYRMFGAQNVTLYDFHSEKKVIGPVLDAYLRTHSVTLVHWNFPVSAAKQLKKRNTKEIFWVIECGQLAALTDCLYRNMNKFKYLAIVDMDEFLVPRANNTWKELFKVLPQSAGAYLFQNRFYRIDWMTPSEIMENAILLNDTRVRKYNPKSLTVTKSEFVGEVTRPKYILRTEACLATRVHRPRMFAPWTEYVVPKHLGLSHHYRYGGRGPAVLRGHPRETDNYMWKFKDSLLTRMEAIFNKTGAQITG